MNNQKEWSHVTKNINKKYKKCTVRYKLIEFKTKFYSYLLLSEVKKESFKFE